MRLAYRLYRLLSWARYWVPRRFTPAGLLVLAALLVSGAVGVDIEQSVAFEVFALAACLLAVSMGAAWFFRGRFAVRRILPRFGSVGHPLAYSVCVRNLTAGSFRGLELLEDIADPRPSLAEFRALQKRAAKGRSFRFVSSGTIPFRNCRAKVKAVELPAMASGSEAESQVELIPLRRGLLCFTGATVARTDPFGLFRSLARVPLPDKVLILPERYPLPAIALTGTRKYQQGGVALASAIGESDEFVSLREYRPGDPMRRIHWRSWARVGHPVVREYQDEFFVRHALILDTFAGPDQTGAFEEAVSIASSFACSIDTQESLLDLMFVGPRAVCFTTGRGLSHTEQALEILASVEACHDRAFRTLRDLVLQHAGGVSSCVAVLLQWDQPRRELIRQLRSLALSPLVLVVTEPHLAEQVHAATAEDRPDNFHVLEVGRIAEGLRGLGKTNA